MVKLKSSNYFIYFFFAWNKADKNNNNYKIDKDLPTNVECSGILYNPYY